MLPMSSRMFVLLIFPWFLFEFASSTLLRRQDVSEIVQFKSNCILDENRWINKKKSEIVFCSYAFGNFQIEQRVLPQLSVKAIPVNSLTLRSVIENYVHILDSLLFRRCSLLQKTWKIKIYLNICKFNVTLNPQST